MAAWYIDYEILELHTRTYMYLVLIVKKKIYYNLPMKIINGKQLTVCSCNQCTPVT